MKTITLATGNQMPLIGLGTWQLQDTECTDAVEHALSVGYTHIDTADRYDNHSMIARALKSCEKKREELFVTSKVWGNHLEKDKVVEDVTRFLDELRIDYLDLALIHWPNKDIPIKRTFEAFEQLISEGRIKQYGVSNFTIKHLEEAQKWAATPICVNQVEFHPYLVQTELLEHCKKNNIILTAYCPLARGQVLREDRLVDVAKKHGKSPAQIVLRWLTQQGIVAIPKSSNPDNIDANLDIFDFELSEEDIRLINTLNKDMRICNPPFAEFDI